MLRTRKQLIAGISALSRGLIRRRGSTRWARIAGSICTTKVEASAGRSGGWRQEQTVWEGDRVNNPLIPFTTEKHPGALGKSFSLVRISNPAIRVLAFKKAEDSDELVLRMVELNGKPAPNMRVSF